MHIEHCFYACARLKKRAGYWTTPKRHVAKWRCELHTSTTQLHDKGDTRSLCVVSAPRTVYSCSYTNGTIVSGLFTLDTEGCCSACKSDAMCVSWQAIHRWQQRSTLWSVHLKNLLPGHLCPLVLHNFRQHHLYRRWPSNGSVPCFAKGLSVNVVA